MNPTYEVAVAHAQVTLIGTQKVQFLIGRVGFLAGVHLALGKSLVLMALVIIYQALLEHNAS